MAPAPENWASWHGSTHPVLTDPNWAFADTFVQGTGSFGIPAYTILNRELEIVSWAQSGGLDENLVLSLLNEPIPEAPWLLP